LFGPRTIAPGATPVSPQTPANAATPAPENTETPAGSVKRRGHGRRAATEYPGAQIVACSHTELQKGAACLCGCGGQLYEEKEAAPFLQWRGAPLLQATRYDRQVLRCSSCQQRFTAPLPTGVTHETFDATADVALVLAKYGAATPWERTARLQELCGLPLPPAVQWARCEALAETLTPVYEALQKTAANAETVGADDTRVRILAHEKTRRQLLTAQANNTSNTNNANRTVREKEAHPAALPKKQKWKKKTAQELRATKTTGIVTLTPPAVTVLASGPQHAGERMGTLLKFRAPELPAVKQMGDALSQNWSHGAAVEVAKCWAHARSKFVELEDTFPAACAVVLDFIGQLYVNEKAAKEMSAAQRLAYHQEKSQPVLDGLQQWIQLQWREKLVEPNSALGGALAYLENHWEGLSEFVRQENIPLDNNAAGRALRGPVWLRKNALFFRTQHGAEVGDILQSVLQTCARHGVNAWEYLLAVRRHPRAVRENTAAWLPWIWQSQTATAALPRAA
jgi:transposase